MTTPVLQLFFSSTEPGEADHDDKNLIWKDILREGDFAITPGFGKRVPFRIIPEGKSSAKDRVISLAELEAAFADQAFEHVTVPLEHVDPYDSSPEAVLNNTGYVKKLRRKIKDGITYLQGGIGFTEPDVKAKVERGTIPNCSSAVLFNHTRKADGKEFPVALNHVALTKKPVVNKLDPFKQILASDDIEDPVLEVYQFADDDSDRKTVDVVWDEKDGAQWLQGKLQQALSPESAEVEDGRPITPAASYFVVDVAPTKNIALVQEYFRGTESKFLIPFTVEDEKVEPAPSVRWTQVRSAMVAASDTDDPVEIAVKENDFTNMSTDKIREKLGIALSEMLGKDAEGYEVGEVTVDKRCKITNSEGVSFVAPFLLSDNGDRVYISVSSQWERISIPTKNEQPVIKASDPAPDVSFINDTPEAKVQAARARRKQMLLSGHR